MTAQRRPGQDLSEEELAQLSEVLQEQYPDEEVVVVYDRPPAPAESRPNFAQKLVVGLITALAALYLANPTAGVFELIPDVIPIVGNLDEVTAFALLVSGLNFFGVNIGWLMTIFGGAGKQKRR